MYWGGEKIYFYNGNISADMVGGTYPEQKLYFAFGK